ncbi:rare lipoprotein A [Streptosporangium becharense]|uniref:Probable endolytic peptidoglycan transglycosylase RlpA n=1 Tax=Streptosporangium becharense TaxID=1816182 RepID=A0A7W9MJ19_9ACTN|nr:septal ring lytic transglycosylase RlpA family protein [Streptosporangium becharense]MBB2913135.1 rare lipoprotein A [Streptosporangium becharense]MBB5822118.1 rare lipoprotein A [Streptosporangium becharense]
MGQHSHTPSSNGTSAKKNSPESAMRSRPRLTMTATAAAAAVLVTASAAALSVSGGDSSQAPAQTRAPAGAAAPGPAADTTASRPGGPPPQGVSGSAADETTVSDDSGDGDKTVSPSENVAATKAEHRPAKVLRATMTRETSSAPKARVLSTGTCGASFYSDPQATASGERFNPNAMTAAHKSLPMGTKVRVTNSGTGESVTVRINDRGPYVGGRCLDLSRAAFSSIGDTGSGVMRVKYEVLAG